MGLHATDCNGRGVGSKTRVQLLDAWSLGGMRQQVPAPDELIWARNEISQIARGREISEWLPTALASAAVSAERTNVRRATIGLSANVANLPVVFGWLNRVFREQPGNERRIKISRRPPNSVTAMAVAKDPNRTVHARYLLVVVARFRRGRRAFFLAIDCGRCDSRSSAIKSALSFGPPSFSN